MTAGKPTYKHVTVSLALSDHAGEYRKEIDGFRVGAGLAVHRGVIYRNGESTNEWTITHLPSGRRVLAPFRTRAQAFEAAERLRRLTNWSKPYDGSEATWGPKDLGKKVQAIYRRVNRLKEAS